MTLNLTLTDLHEQPFRYGIFSSVFSARAHADLLAWLETEDAWKLAETEFYEQYEFSVDDVDLPESVRFLQSPVFQEEVRAAIGSLFGVELSDEVRVVVHKLVPGQHIGIHNDVIEGGESHRLTVQLNRGLDDKDGGYFMLFNSEDPSDIHRILKPVTNSALAFAISERSNHAVSTQQGGVRYTFVFCFHAG